MHGEYSDTLCSKQPHHSSLVFKIILSRYCKERRVLQHSKVKKSVVCLVCVFGFFGGVVFWFWVFFLCFVHFLPFVLFFSFFLHMTLELLLTNIMAFSVGKWHVAYEPQNALGWNSEIWRYRHNFSCYHHNPIK